MSEDSISIVNVEKKLLSSRQKSLSFFSLYLILEWSYNRQTLQLMPLLKRNKTNGEFFSLGIIA